VVPAITVCSKDTYTVKVRRKTIADKMIFLIVLGIGYIIDYFAGVLKWGVFKLFYGYK